MEKRFIKGWWGRGCEGGETVPEIGRGEDQMQADRAMRGLDLGWGCVESCGTHRVAGETRGGVKAATGPWPSWATGWEEEPVANPRRIGRD